MFIQRVISCATAIWLATACSAGQVVMNGGNDPDGSVPPDDPDADPEHPPPIDASQPDPVDANHTPADAAPPQDERLRMTNQCNEPVWIAHSDNLAQPQNIRLEKGQSHDYDIPDDGIGSVRLWPKLGCDGSGHACRIGDTGEGGGIPCGPNGCHPPIDSKFEVSYSAIGSSAFSFYNLSAVDGFTLPFKVLPKGPGANSGSCVASDCATLTLASCPQHEDMSGGGEFPAFADVDLRAINQQGQVVGCMSPCKKWNYSFPFGLAKPESQDPGLHMCCPTPIAPESGNCTEPNGCIGPDECRSTSDPMGVERTSYVDIVRTECPSAYSYSYDDGQGLHACPSAVKFEVVFCP
jgi:hypothetical protein